MSTNCERIAKLLNISETEAVEFCLEVQKDRNDWPSTFVIAQAISGYLESRACARPHPTDIKEWLRKREEETQKVEHLAIIYGFSLQETKDLCKTVYAEIGYSVSDLQTALKEYADNEPFADLPACVAELLDLVRYIKKMTDEYHAYEAKRIQEEQDRLKDKKKRFDIQQEIYSKYPVRRATAESVFYARDNPDNLSFLGTYHYHLDPVPSSSDFRESQDRLERGTRPIEKEADLNLYIAAYGAHHFFKLWDAFKNSNLEEIQDKTIEIIDWGCGQALASWILIDYLALKNIQTYIHSITLIEPSKFALERGLYYLQRVLIHAPECAHNIRTVRQRIGDVNPETVKSHSDAIKIHLFSNVLDVKGLDITILYQLICSALPGYNRFICVSPKYSEAATGIDDLYHQFSNRHMRTISSRQNCDQPVWGEIFSWEYGKFLKLNIFRKERQFHVDL